MGITLDGRPCVEAGQLLEYCDAKGIDTSSFVGKANAFFMPSGSNYGRGWCLLLRSDLDQIDIESLLDFSFDDNDGGSVVFSKLVFIRADAVTAGIDDDPNVVMICELADCRYLLHNPYYSYPLNEQFNVRAPSGGSTIYYPHTSNDPSGTPALDLATDVGSNLGTNNWHHI